MLDLVRVFEHSSFLQWVCWKRGVYFAKVNKDYTSQVCPSCDTHTGKKELSDRIHTCLECGHTPHIEMLHQLK